MLKLYSLLISILFAWTASAQPQFISGTVSDADGNPMLGVTVVVKGTATGTITEFDGTYQVSAAASDVLIFSYIGYVTQEIAVGERSTINVVMTENAVLLEGVVVIGYGTQKKKDLTTAVVTIDEKTIRDRPMVSAAEALQGTAAGVQVVQPSGKPGGDISVRVRGATSVLAGNEPLYIVDGVPTTDIRGLNPGDIETMSVLKDASSAAIYGARAANGVVLITTKRGKENNPVIRLNAYKGFSNLRKPLETLTTKQYRDLINEISPGALDPTATGYTNWIDTVFGTGQIQNYQLAFSDGTDKFAYMVSFNYLDNQGIVQPARFDRYSLRLNLDNQLKKWLKTGVSINVLSSRTKDTPDNASSGRGGVIMSALNTPPFLNVYKDDGSGWFDPNPFQPSWENPIAYMEGPDQLNTDNRLFGNLNAEATLFKGFALRTNLGIDLNSHQWDYYLDPVRTNFGRQQNGIGRSDKSNTTSWIWENTANYATSFGKNNMSVITYVAWPGQGFYTNKPINSTSDLAGLKLRIYSQQTRILGEKLDTEAIILPFAEVPQAFATGLINSLWTSAQSGTEVQAWDYVNTFTYTGTLHQKNAIIVNNRALNALDDDTRKIVLDAGAAATTRGWEMAKAAEREKEQVLADHGMTIARAPDDVLERIEEIGAGMVEEWLNAASEEERSVYETYRAALGR